MQLKQRYQENEVHIRRASEQ